MRLLEIHRPLDIIQLTAEEAEILFDFVVELREAQKTHPAFPTLHHGLAVIEEELEELRREVFNRNPDASRCRKEALQVMTMGFRFILDLISTVQKREDTFK